MIDPEQVCKIAEHIIGEFIARCDKCGKESTTQCFTDDEAAEHFHTAGWRAKRVRLLCPTCVSR